MAENNITKQKVKGSAISLLKSVNLWALIIRKKEVVIIS